MAYSVMLWLVNPGEYPQEAAEEEKISGQGGEPAGARSGSNIGYALPRMVFGVYDEQAEAEEALAGIMDRLQNNAPLQIDARSSYRTFLIPAQRVHYIVCEEVQRPKD